MKTFMGAYEHQLMKQPVLTAGFTTMRPSYRYDWNLCADNSIGSSELFTVIKSIAGKLNIMSSGSFRSRFKRSV